MTVSDAKSAFVISNVLNSITINDYTINTSSVLLTNNTFSIKIFNFPNSITQVEAEKLILSKISETSELKDINIISFMVIFIFIIIIINNNN